jgi:hypothetical protein
VSIPSAARNPQLKAFQHLSLPPRDFFSHFAHSHTRFENKYCRNKYSTA